MEGLVMKLLLAFVLIASCFVSTVSYAEFDAPKVYGADGKYLGDLDGNSYNPNSTSNEYGQYGSKYSPNSINNEYGQYYVKPKKKRSRHYDSGSALGAALSGFNAGWGN